MQYQQAPWAILTKFCVVDGFLSPFSEAKFQHYGYRNVGWSSSKSRKFRMFGKKFSLRDKSPWAIFTKFGAGRVSQVRTLKPNFTIVALKM